MLYIAIGYEDGEAVEGRVFQAYNDKDAAYEALAWAREDGAESFDVYAYKPDWSPGRKVEVTENAYLRLAMKRSGR